MKINMDEINSLSDYMKQEEYENLLGELEESDSYSDLLDNIMVDFKHIAAEYLRIAISCHFDSEILSQDYKIPDEIIELYLSYKCHELEVDL